ncbi:hypothetical protein HOLleu_05463 [Holothuria leucospilota]|uniref:Uncharacterized protein n=1 Tax=Holothuria leucospilota TaxID=206669 RepID=A0A9Q1CK38_HOLLE|nr:hypothetical protein HOLleu_05463 [Holothuria leucospilota]
MRKDEIKRYVLEYLVDESILPSTVLETLITVPTDNTFELKRLEMEMNKEEDNVEKFFNHFEKLGEQLKWPRDKWSILIQSNFTGKAQEVYSALSIEDSMDYDKEFKRCVNDDIKTYLEENKADKLSEVANLADQYALTHKFSKVGQTQNKGQCSRPNKKYGNSSGTPGNSGSQSGSICPTNSGKKQPDSSRQKNDQVSSNKAAFKDIICGFCHKKGHTIANCFQLAKLKESETASNVLANVENSPEVVVTLRPNSNEQIKEEYLPFVSEGFISLDGNSAHPPVKIKILQLCVTQAQLSRCFLMEFCHYRTLLPHEQMY